jgi:hypothetical protein
MRHLLFSLLILLVVPAVVPATVAAQPATARAATSLQPVVTRTLHVSPQPLANVPATQQFRTISEAAKIVVPGDLVKIHSGIYRETVRIEKSGTKERPIRFEAANAASVVVTGADRITDWQKEGTGADNIYSTPWPHVFIEWSAPHYTHPGDEYHRVIGRAEQVLVDDYALQQVLDLERMNRGTFYVDNANKRLYVWTVTNTDFGNEPNWAPRVEASTRNVLWECTGDYVHVRGIRFRYAANRAQEAATQFKGRGDVIEDCIFERTNASGAAFMAEDQVVRRCTFQDNGQLGFGANRAHRLLFTENLVRNNNTKNFHRGWEAGGNKLAFCRGVVIEKSRFLDNRGNGIWFDIGNEQNTVRNCLIADNEDAGIFYEISFTLHVHDNVIIGNALQSGPGAWGAAAGVSLSSSPGCVIERNLLIGNKEGFNLREQTRTTPLIESKNDEKEVPVWNHDETIRNNVIAYNRDAQSWGWFDINDERHWPAAMQEKKSEAGQATADNAKDYVAKTTAGQPVGLSLEKLKISFANNLYAPGDNGGLFNWGVQWKRNKKYAALDEVRRELSLEQGSRVAPFIFRDYLARDFRVPAHSPALKMNCYPRGEVPGVRLGVLPR